MPNTSIDWDIDENGDWWLYWWSPADARLLKGSIRVEGYL